MSRKHSSAQTHRRRRARRTDPFGGGHNDDIGVQLAWSPDAEHLDEAKRRTHDALIRMMGSARSGGVRWSITTVPAALKNLQLLDEDASDEWQEKVGRPIRERLEEHGGFLVAAMAPGRAPGGRR